MKPEKMIWYKFYIQDYQRDTGHLSLMEHGAYRLLIDKCFLSGGILPSSIESIYRLTSAMTKPEQEAVRSVLHQFFESSPDGFTHKRVAKELNQLTLAGSASRGNGANGGRPKRVNRSSKKEPKNNLAGFENRTGQVNPPEPGENPDPNLDITLVISHESDILTSLPTAQARTREGSFQIMPRWEPDDGFWDLAKRAGYLRDSPDYDDALTEFVAYWLTRPGSLHTQSEWDKSFLESWKRHRTYTASGGRQPRKRSSTLSPHNDFEKRDYSVGINPDGSF